MKITKKMALRYHEKGRPGKIEVTITKPAHTQLDLSLAYTPGVAIPVMEIADDPDNAYRYTAKGNLVAVISNGTAILGLGDQGPLASKPVMEGKGLLFKRFADVDVFDIEIDAHTPEEIIKVCQALGPTFGGINLEDIKAPECFVVEETLKKTMDIPVFHDDQHGTAIIATAGLINAMELLGKKMADLKVTVSGAGASAIATAEMFIVAGVQRKNISLVDSRGVVQTKREKGINEYKARFMQETDARTLADAMAGCDVFVGLSVKDLVSQDMVRSMADNPVIFAMANPDPEITYEKAKEARSDVLMATGRSDYPNQVNNVLGFPFIFRGALDVHASDINEEMKLAAAQALANLAREDVPDAVLKAYNLESLHFGAEYIIPKPVDPRVLLWVSPAVAKAAMDTGVARKQIDIEAYVEELEARLGKGWELMRHVINKARHNPKRIVFGEGEHPKIIRAAAQIAVEGIGEPILLGRPEVIKETIEELELHFEPQIVNPTRCDQYQPYCDTFFEERQRKGITYPRARTLMRRRNYFGPMMVKMGDADAYISGMAHNYPTIIRPALETIGTSPDTHKVAGMHIVIVKDKVYFFVDTTVNIDPNAEDLAEITCMAAKEVRRFDIKPRVAMLSFSNFGGTRHPNTEKIQQAVAMVKERCPDLPVDGEMMAATALSPERLDNFYPFATVRKPNVFVFPNLEAANIAYQLMGGMSGAEIIGPILLGMDKPVHILQRDDEARNVVNMAALAVVDAQERG